MKRIIYIICTVAASLCMASCQQKDLEAQDVFLVACKDAGLTIDGQTIFDFDENTCQMGCSEDQLQFRVSDDTMSNFYVLTVNRMPGSVGSTLKGSLIWSTDVDVRERDGLEFKVIRVQGDWYWLWNKKSDIGVVVRYVK